MIEQVKAKLIKHPEYRERRKKAEFVARWLHNKYPSLLGDIEKLKTIEDMVDEVINVERLWRKVLQDNVELRGNDYKTKDMVVADKILDLGYVPHFHTDIKKGKTL